MTTTEHQPPEAGDPVSSRTRVSVVIPALNEARNLPFVFERLPDDIFEVIVVDGGSVDGTPETAGRLRSDVRVIGQTRRGKGNALACGFVAARGDVIVALDADGSTDPAEIPRFVTALEDGAAYVKGTRFAAGGGSSDITRIRRAGNRLLNGLVNVTCGLRNSDLCYGYFGFWARHLPVLDLDAHSAGAPLWGDGFEIETLVTLRMTRNGLAAVEVPSFERRRLYGESNLRAFTDGWRILTVIVQERRRRPTPAVSVERLDDGVRSAERA